MIVYSFIFVSFGLKVAVALMYKEDVDVLVNVCEVVSFFFGVGNSVDVTVVFSEAVEVLLGV